MATKNPKISVYVSERLKKALEGEKESRKSYSLSAVAVELLEEKLGLREPAQEPAGNAWVEQFNARLEALETKVFPKEKPPEDTENMWDVIARQQKQSASKKKASEIGKQGSLLTEQSSASVTHDDAQETQILPLKEVIELTGIGLSTLTQARREKKLPKARNGWEVTRFVGKEKRGQSMVGLWEVKKLKTPD